MSPLHDNSASFSPIENGQVSASVCLARSRAGQGGQGQGQVSDRYGLSEGKGMDPSLYHFVRGRSRREGKEEEEGRSYRNGRQPQGV